MLPKAFNDGFGTKLPPVAASYQMSVSPALTLALAVRVWSGLSSHSLWFPPERGGRVVDVLIFKVMGSVRNVQFVVSIKQSYVPESTTI